MLDSHSTYTGYKWNSYCYWVKFNLTKKKEMRYGVRFEFRTESGNKVKKIYYKKWIKLSCDFVWWHWVFLKKLYFTK